jgi:hypothetical protein
MELVAVLFVVSALLLFVAVITLITLLIARPQRKRRLSFKKRHGLDQRQPLAGFEQRLAMAMFTEGREVFVTAFCTEVEVLSVTATVGTARQCRPSDRVENWGQKARRLGASQIRQYHNHPNVWGRSIPSSRDYSTNKYLRGCVEPYGIRLHTLLIYKPWFGTYMVKEYH